MQGVVQAFVGDDAVFVTVHHGGEVFVHVVEEQEHVAACGNGGGDHVAALHAAGEAHHMAGVCEHHAVEAHFALEQVRQQLLRQRGRHDVVVLDVRVHGTGIAWKHDMSGHDGLQPVVDEVCVDFAEGGVPFLAGKGVDAVGNMLVTVIQAVAGEVLGRAAEAGHLVRALHVGLGHFHHALRIVAVGAQADDGVVPVVVNIGNRSETEVAADGRGLRVGHFAKRFGVFCVARRADLCLCADHCAVAARAVAAVLGIAGDDERNFGIFLQNTVLLMHLGRGAGVVADTADVVFVNGHFQIFLGAGGTHVEKQLADLFLKRHRGDGVLHPLHSLVIQVIGLCTHIHGHSIRSFLFVLFRLIILCSFAPKEE